MEVDVYAKYRNPKFKEDEERVRKYKGIGYICYDEDESFDFIHNEVETGSAGYNTLEEAIEELERTHSEWVKELKLELCHLKKVLRKESKRAYRYK